VQLSLDAYDVSVLAAIDILFYTHALISFALQSNSLPTRGSSGWLLAIIIKAPNGLVAQARRKIDIFMDQI
jgi:hypothetical protein